MPDVELKLKQASAVLGVPPKDLQNLVQFGVVKPTLRGRVFWFDRQGLLRAKVAFYLKESLGASTPFLAQFTDALFDKKRRPAGQSKVTLLSRPPGGGDPLEMRVPLGSLARQIEQRMPLAKKNPDLPKGRKRAEWAKEFLATLMEISKDLQGVTDGEILAAVRAERQRVRAAAEVQVSGGKAKATARGR